MRNNPNRKHDFTDLFSAEILGCINKFSHVIITYKTYNTFRFESWFLREMCFEVNSFVNI